MADQGETKLTEQAEAQRPKLADAMKDHQPQTDLTGEGQSRPDGASGPVQDSQVPESSHANAGFQSRDDYLVHIGRGHDTSGRQSQKG